MALSATIVTSVKYDLPTSANTVGTVTEAVSLGATAYGLNAGTLAGQISVAGSVLINLVASSVTYDLTAFPTPTGNKVFTKVKLIYVVNDSAADGATLWLGNAASNPWYAGFTDTPTARFPVAAGSSFANGNLLLQGVNPWGVDGTHKLLKIDSGSASISGKLVILGI